LGELRGETGAARDASWWDGTRHQALGAGEKLFPGEGGRKRSRPLTAELNLNEGGEDALFLTHRRKREALDCPLAIEGKSLSTTTPEEGISSSKGEAERKVARAVTRRKKDATLWEVLRRFSMGGSILRIKGTAWEEKWYCLACPQNIRRKFGKKPLSPPPSRDKKQVAKKKKESKRVRLAVAF